MLCITGVRFQCPNMQQTMNRLNIPQLKESVAVLKSDLSSLKMMLEAKTEENTPFEYGQEIALQIVFTHNDLLSGNVLIPMDFFEQDGVSSMRFIDYEYAGYNSRAFDLANHFCG